MPKAGSPCRSPMEPISTSEINLPPVPPSVPSTRGAASTPGYSCQPSVVRPHMRLALKCVDAACKAALMGSVLVVQGCSPLQ